MSRQKLGQHFLSNPAWRQRIANTLPADANATWLEIGAGHGEMTEFLAQRARRVIAIETDAALASTLRERAADWPNVEVFESDILSADLAALTHEPFRVYGNLPYYITSPILTRLFSCAAQIDSIHVVIQWEVAARITATPGHREYAYLSALCQYFARPKIILRIPPGAFRPPPKVNSALVAMSLPGERAHLNMRDDAAFLKFLQNCFSHKRKTLRNNLKDCFSDETIGAALAACQLTPKARAEEMSLPEFAQLYGLLVPEK
ncbi:MAG: 16S rRNA (adenine(1518)-N(6)/adenine(1519)-N(6))-dimethyltransferase RsmA [Candidatus Acidiferrales bacterium]